MPTDPTTWLMLFVVGAGVLALWLHRIDALSSLLKPTMERMREGEIANRTESLKQRAWNQNEHHDDRDLSARLQDSLHTSVGDPFAPQEEQYLPGLGPMPTEWTEPTPPEARR